MGNVSSPTSLAAIRWASSQNHATHLEVVSRFKVTSGSGWMVYTAPSTDQKGDIPPGGCPEYSAHVPVGATKCR
ncbi:unnamed protein product, partial [Ectocarpus fasciculatus]